jgi:hypothetical protein
MFAQDYIFARSTTTFRFRRKCDGRKYGTGWQGAQSSEPQVNLAFTKATTRCRVGEIRPDCHPFSALERTPATCRELHCRIIRGKSEVSAQCDPENKKPKTGWRRRGDSNPRDPFESNGFQDRRLQPLGHSSVFNSNVFCNLEVHL